MKKAIFGIIPILLLVIIAILIYTGVIQLNRPSAEIFPVRGVDVSHHQGNVDWNQLQAQGVMFAYIKATEGSSYQDSAFQTNWAKVNLTDLLGFGVFKNRGQQIFKIFPDQLIFRQIQRLFINIAIINYNVKSIITHAIRPPSDNF